MKIPNFIVTQDDALLISRQALEVSTSLKASFALTRGERLRIAALLATMAHFIDKVNDKLPVYHRLPSTP